MAGECLDISPAIKNHLRSKMISIVSSSKPVVNLPILCSRCRYIGLRFGTSKIQCPIHKDKYVTCLNKLCLYKEEFTGIAIMCDHCSDEDEDGIYHGVF